MTRREFVRSALFTSGSYALASPDNKPRSPLGIATTSYLTAWRPKDTGQFLEHCHTLGAAGIQAPINGDLQKIRSRAEEWGMYIEAMVSLPRGSDTSQFEAALKAAQMVGALAVRTECLGGRRYEVFTSLAQWEDFVTQSKASLEFALPLLEHYKMPLALENHKDWTADELVALVKTYSSEYLGVCLDFGNNIALLDEPMYTIEKLAPYTIATHVKNMAVQPYEDGFLLSEVLFDQGVLDMRRAFSLVQQYRPKARFTLEMITRDPLRVPCLTDKYWVTFPDRNGLYLARTLEFVRRQKAREALPRVSQFSHEEQLRMEEQNVVACLDYARHNLSL